jgi:hypothetical protein
VKEDAMSTTGPSDPNVEPGQVEEIGTVDLGDQDGTPITDVGSAPALQPREGEGDMLT